MYQYHHLSEDAKKVAQQENLSEQDKTDIEEFYGCGEMFDKK